MTFRHRRFVTLKVYDVIGQEVAATVNGEFNAGSCRVMFDPERLASGVYFYRLQAGSFIEIKKLVLLKWGNHNYYV